MFSRTGSATDHPLPAALDLRSAKVEEVARVVPDEPVALDGSTVASDLVFGFHQEVVVVAQPVGEREAAHASSDDQVPRAIHIKVRVGFLHTLKGIFHGGIFFGCPAREVTSGVNPFAYTVLWRMVPLL